MLGSQKLRTDSQSDFVYSIAVPAQLKMRIDHPTCLNTHALQVHQCGPGPRRGFGDHGGAVHHALRPRQLCCKMFQSSRNVLERLERFDRFEPMVEEQEEMALLTCVERYSLTFREHTNVGGG